MLINKIKTATGENISIGKKGIPLKKDEIFGLKSIYSYFKMLRVQWGLGGIMYRNLQWQPIVKALVRKLGRQIFWGILHYISRYFRSEYTTCCSMNLSYYYIFLLKDLPQSISGNSRYDKSSEVNFKFGNIHMSWLQELELFIRCITLFRRFFFS